MAIGRISRGGRKLAKARKNEPENGQGVKISVGEIIKIAQSSLRYGGIGPRTAKDSPMTEEQDRVSSAKKSGRKLIQTI